MRRLLVFATNLTMSPILKVRDLVKRYGDTVAVDGLNFDVSQGEIFAFLGENGAGKTTTISCLIGIDQATSGEIELQGGQIKRENGY